jgi:hypothetical protein
MGMDSRKRGRRRTALLTWTVSVLFFALLLNPPGSHAGMSIGGGPPNPGVQGGSGGAANTNGAAATDTTGTRGAPPARGSAAGAPARKAGPVLAHPALKKPIMLTPRMISPGERNTDPKPEFLAVINAFNNFNSGSHSLRMQCYTALAEKCANKQYTTQDQMMAGCLGSDTLDQCSKKLYKWCVVPYKSCISLQDKTNILQDAEYLDTAVKAFIAKWKILPDPK